MKVLLIEDVSFSRKLVEGQLQKLGHTVISAGSGYEGLDLLQSESLIGLVICDLYLPDVSGFHIFQECELLPRFKQGEQVPPPFVLLTSSNNLKDLQQAEEMGFLAALSKPLSITELDNLIQSLGNSDVLLKVSHNKGKVLLVDSQGHLFRVVQEVMKGNGLTLITASSGKECLDYLQEYSNIQLIISDLELKDINAIHLQRRCQESLPESMPPFVLMAASSYNMELLQIAYLSNFSDIIISPFDKYSIRQRLSQLFLTEGSPHGAHKSILLVDDIYFHCALTKVILQKNTFVREGKYNILVADSGIKALEYLKTDSSIQLVITDYYLPDMDGMEIYKNMIETLDKSKKITGIEGVMPTFILLTISSNEELRRQALKEGFKAVFRKPIDSESFLTLLNSLLSSKDKMNTV